MFQNLTEDEQDRVWIRTIVSSVVAYVLDIVFFVLIAFAGTIPWCDILLMIALQYVMKIGIEVFFGTPLAYSMIGFINKKVGYDRGDCQMVIFSDSGK